MVFLFAIATRHTQKLRQCLAGGHKTKRPGRIGPGPVKGLLLSQQILSEKRGRDSRQEFSALGFCCKSCEWREFFKRLLIKRRACSFGSLFSQRAGLRRPVFEKVAPITSLDFESIRNNVSEFTEIMDGARALDLPA